MTPTETRQELALSTDLSRPCLSALRRSIKAALSGDIQFIDFTMDGPTDAKVEAKAMLSEGYSALLIKDDRHGYYECQMRQGKLPCWELSGRGREHRAFVNAIVEICTQVYSAQIEESARLVLERVRNEPAEFAKALTWRYTKKHALDEYLSDVLTDSGMTIRISIAKLCEPKNHSEYLVQLAHPDLPATFPTIFVEDETAEVFAKAAQAHYESEWMRRYLLDLPQHAIRMFEKFTHSK